jgi:hypothetical protein
VIEPRQIEWFGNIRKDAVTQRVSGGSRATTTGEDEDRGADPEAAHVVQHLEPIHPWHVEIEHDEVEWVAQYSRERVNAIAGSLDLVFVGVLKRLKRLRQYGDDSWLVIDDQHGLGRSSSFDVVGL